MTEACAYKDKVIEEKWHMFEKDDVRMRMWIFFNICAIHACKIEINC